MPIVASGSAPSYAVPAVINIADLRLLAAGAFPVVMLEGTSTAGDGGGGFFYWSQSSVAADDSSLVVAPSSGITGRWLRLNTSALGVTVTQSGTGAVADTLQGRGRMVVYATDFMTAAQRLDVLGYTGSVDVSAAINAAIVSLPSSGGAVLFPPGKYKLTSPIDMLPNVTLAGTMQLSNTSSFARGAILYAVHSGYIIRRLLSAAEESNMAFFDLYMDGTSTATRGIYLQNYRGVVINRVQVIRTQNYGIYLDELGSGTSYTYSIIDSYVNGGNANAAIDAKGAHGRITRTNTDGGLYSLYLDDDSSDALVTGCHFEGATDTGVLMGGSTGLNKLIGNHISMTVNSATNQYGVQIKNTGGNVMNIVSNNDIQLGATGVTNAYGIYEVGSGSGPSNFGGNSITGIWGRGISVGASGATLIGNDIQLGAGTGDCVTIVSSNNVSIIGGFLNTSGTNAVNSTGGGTGNTLCLTRVNGGSVTGIDSQFANTGALTIAGAITAAGNATLTGTTPVLTLGAKVANSGALIKMLGSSTQINWQISQNTYVVGAWELSYSTAGGGSTFTAQALVFGPTGGQLLGAPTGGDKGLGTLNAATGYYLNNSLLLGAKDTTISTGVGSVKMKSANPATNTAWIPITSSDGTVYYVPGWTTNNP